MRVIKKDTLSVLHQIFGWKDKFYLSVAVMAGFDLDDPTRLLSEADMWAGAASALGPDQVLDLSMPKPQGEVLVFGKCFAPRGREITGAAPYFRVGPLTKRAIVFGRRFHRSGPFVHSSTNPEPFTEMDLSWENAFGGPGYGLNPVGKGLIPVQNQRGETLYPLPNVEDPDHLLTSLNDRPHPFAFGPLGLDWPARLKNIGHFDKKWFTERWPGLPDDFNFHYFNLAPEDQRLDGFFKGDEPIQIRSMHPDKHDQLSHLPGLGCRLFVNQTSGQGEAFQEWRTDLDTLILIPHLDLGLLIWHGLGPSADDEAENISHILTDLEPIADSPKNKDYYRGCLINGFEDPPMEPPLEALVEKTPVDTEGAPETQTPSTETVMPEAPDSGPADNPSAFLETEPVENDQRFDILMRLLGMPPDQGFPPASASPVMPEPADMAGALIAYLKMGGSNPEVLTAMLDLAREGKKITRELADLEKLAELPLQKPAEEPEPSPPEVDSPPREPRDPTRESVLAGYALGKSFAGRDLTGLDLSGCCLAGIDLYQAMLEDVNFSRADLSQADLTGAILTGADLTGAVMSESRLSRVSASRAIFTGADLSGANLSAGDFTGADMSQARLIQADLSGGRFNDALIVEINGMGVKAPKADFSGAQVRKASFVKAEMPGALFSGAGLNSASFSETILTEARFDRAKGEGALFQNADLCKCRADDGAAFKKCKFTGANLADACWENVDLEESDFTGAKMQKMQANQCHFNKADLTGADARQADFSKSDFSEARMSGLNLMEGSLRKARLVGTDLQGANLYGVNFHKSIVGGTKLKGANLDRTLLAMGKSVL